MPTPLRKVNKHNAPTKRFEHTLWSAGKKYVVGIDEVGRGAWAGPLTIAAAVIPKDRRLYKVRDSKALNEKEKKLNEIITGYKQSRHRAKEVFDMRHQ